MKRAVKAFPREGSDPSDAESIHYAALERDAPAGPTGLCITPNLIGTCNPDFNPHARGIISGLSPNTTRSQIYKGILEGLACELSQMTEILANAVGEFRDIYVTGGGSRSALGLQLRAALSGRRLHVMKCPEAVCLGGAILAGVAAGEYGSLREAVELRGPRCFCRFAGQRDCGSLRATSKTIPPFAFSAHGDHRR